MGMATVLGCSETDICSGDGGQLLGEQIVGHLNAFLSYRR